MSLFIHPLYLSIDSLQEGVDFLREVLPPAWSSGTTGGDFYRCSLVVRAILRRDIRKVGEERNE
jgi:hypothetical protein